MRYKNNKIMKEFKLMDYRVEIISYDILIPVFQKYTPVCDKGYLGDAYLSLWNIILKTSILFPLEQDILMQKNSIEKAFNILNKSEKNQKPKFVFVHIMSPHPPYPHSNANEENNDYRYVVGNKAISCMNTRSFVEQVEYVNIEVEKIVEKIISTKPIIIISADHGINYFAGVQNRTNILSDDKKVDAYRKARFRILNAMYLPDTNIKIPEDTSPVNNFRIVLNAYFGAKLGILPNKSLYSDDKVNFIDITEKVRYK